MGYHLLLTCLISCRTLSLLHINFKVWNIASHECLKTLDWMSNEGHTGVIRWVNHNFLSCIFMITFFRCLQADDWRILSAADDKMIKVWNLGKRFTYSSTPDVWKNFWHWSPISLDLQNDVYFLKSLSTWISILYCTYNLFTTFTQHNYKLSLWNMTIFFINLIQRLVKDFKLWSLTLMGSLAYNSMTST